MNCYVRKSDGVLFAVRASRAAVRKAVKRWCVAATRRLRQQARIGVTMRTLRLVPVEGGFALGYL